MLSKGQRTAILELHAQKVSKGQIARVLGVSRFTVRKVLRSESSEVPALIRSEKAEPFRQQILEEWANCKGNLVRVHEELVGRGLTLSYSALTAFCRRHGIGQQPRLPSGVYEFQPGEELQHDTSPHLIEIAGKAETRAELVTAIRALDRVLRARRDWIPNWFAATHKAAYWDLFGFKDPKPDYGFPVESLWWRDEEKAKAIGKA